MLFEAPIKRISVPDLSATLPPPIFLKGAPEHSHISGDHNVSSRSNATSFGSLLLPPPPDILLGALRVDLPLLFLRGFLRLELGRLDLAEASPVDKERPRHSGAGLSDRKL
mmetsp:Transcript_38751/g.46926  ORF Transcript_38751/g.46926 Transcript_38751/m.46926 type:complete len:111 (+) Transcript_38751:136-468(+)